MGLSFGNFPEGSGKSNVLLTADIGRRTQTSSAQEEQNYSVGEFYHAQVNPNFAAAHNNLGLAYMDLREWAKARAAFEDAIRLAPAYAEAHNNLGYLLLS